MRTEDILIFKKNGEERYLYAFSVNVRKLLCLHPSWVKKVSRTKEFFEMRRMFSLKGNTINKDMIASINIGNVMSYLAFIKHIAEIDENCEIIDQISNYEKQCEATTKIEYYNLKLLYSIESRCGLFEIFTFKQVITLTETKDEKVKADLEKARLEDEIVSTLRNTVSSATSRGYNQNFNLDFKNTQNHDSIRLKRNTSNIKKFTFTILFFTISMIFISIAFLILGFNQKTVSEEYYSIAANFRSFKFLLIHSTLSLLSNYCIPKYGTSVCSNGFKRFSEFYRSIHTNITIDINAYIGDELFIKLQLLKDSYNLLKSNIYSQNKNSMNTLFNFETVYYILENVGDDLRIKNITTAFEQGIQIYLNQFDLILNSEEYRNMPNYLITFNNYLSTASFDNIFEHKNLPDSLKSLYFITINYLNYFRNFLKVEDAIEAKFKEHLEYSNLVILISTIILILLHIIILGICIWFILFFKLIIKDYINDIATLIQGDFMIYISSKMACLRQINNLYVENPNQVIKKIKQARTLLMSKNRESSKYSTDTALEVVPSSIQFSDDQYFQTVRHFFSVLIILFTIYFAYSILSSLLLNGTLTRLDSTLKYSRLISDIDTGTYNNILLLNLIQLNNQTDQDLGRTFGYTEDFGFIRTNLFTNNENMKSAQKYETVDGNIQRLSNYFEINCNSIYESLNDTTIAKANQIYKGKNYLENVINICRSFEIMKVRDDQILIQDMAYRVLKILNSYQKHDYQSILNMYEQDDIYELFAISLVILRPLRTYINEILVVDIVKKTNENYMMIITLYLILNIMIDIIVFLMIRYRIVVEMDELGNNLIYFYYLLKE